MLGNQEFLFHPRQLYVSNFVSLGELVDHFELGVLFVQVVLLRKLLDHGGNIFQENHLGKQSCL